MWTAAGLTYHAGMHSDLDLDAWPRRASFTHFRGLAQPFFSVCARLDVSALHERVACHPGATLFLAYHHAALQAANAVAPFRYRLAGEQVRVYERVHGSTTVLRADQSIGFANLDFEPDYGRFVELAGPVLAAAKQSGPGLGEAAPERAEAMLHMTTIPWLDFTSFSHARGGGTDSVPKLAFGKISTDAAGRRSMAVAVEVHHAMMDGLHVGQFYEAMQDFLDRP
jgi:chloramphenicol O-acetyltransferase type A